MANVKMLPQTYHNIVTTTNFTQNDSL